MKKSILFAVLTVLSFSSLLYAQDFPDTWQSHDLSKYGMSFSIMAPASATFDYDGDMEELYIDAEEDQFRMMISIYEETVEEIIAEMKEEVEEGGDVEFVGYVHDSKNGFLAHEEVEGDTDFEVYYAFSKGGKTFFFQTNPLPDGLYSKMDGEHMYQACKMAAGL